jgi:hypothetical protein
MTIRNGPDAEITPANLVRDIAWSRRLWVTARTDQDRADGREPTITRSGELLDLWADEFPALSALLVRGNAEIDETERDDHEGRLPVATGAWCEAIGPRYGDEGTYCTLPAGHLGNPGRELGRAGHRFTYGTKRIVQDDSVAEPVMFGPHAAPPGPAVLAVRVLAIRFWCLETKRWTWRQTPDGSVFVQSPHGDAWIAQFHDEDGCLDRIENARNWQELSTDRVLVDVTRQVRG